MSLFTVDERFDLVIEALVQIKAALDHSDGGTYGHHERLNKMVDQLVFDRDASRREAMREMGRSGTVGGLDAGPSTAGRYNHVWTLAFSVESNDPEGKDVTAAMLWEAIQARLGGPARRGPARGLRHAG